jgi:hypothetical protein
MSASIALTCSNAPYNRNQKLVFTLNVSNVSDVDTISNIILVLNDESAVPVTMSSAIQYITIPQTLYSSELWINNSISIVKTVTSVIIANEYTARAMLELTDGTIIKSSTLVNLSPNTVPVKPSFILRSIEEEIPLDIQFGFKISNLDDYVDSCLSSVKFIWSSLDGDNSGDIDFKIFPINEDNLYIIDVSDTFFLENHSDSYEVSCVVKNFIGESPVSNTQVYIASNVPNMITGFELTTTPEESTGTEVVSTCSFDIPAELGSDTYTYKVYYIPFAYDTPDASIPALDLSIDNSYYSVDVSGVYVEYEASTPYVGGTVIMPTVDVPSANSLYGKKVITWIVAVSSNNDLESVISEPVIIVPSARNAPLIINRVLVGPLDNFYERVSTSDLAELTSGYRTAYLFTNNPQDVFRGPLASYDPYQAVKRILSENQFVSLSYIGSDLISGVQQHIYVFNNLENDTSYNNVSISLRNGFNSLYGEINEAASVSFTPFTFPDSPSVASIAEGDEKLTVTLTDYVTNMIVDAGITTYQYSIDEGENWVDVTVDSSISFAITGLTNFTNYYVYVRTALTVANFTYYSGYTFDETYYMPFGGDALTVDVSLYAFAGPRNGTVAVTYKEDMSEQDNNGSGNVSLFWTIPSITGITITGFQIGETLYEPDESNTDIFDLTNFNEYTFTISVIAETANGTPVPLTLENASVDIIPFTFISDLSDADIDITNLSQQFNISWTEDVNAMYVIDVSSQTLTSDAESPYYVSTLDNGSTLLVNGKAYSGQITPTYSGLFSSRDIEPMTYYSFSTPFIGYPYTNPNAVSYTVTDEDRNIVVDIDNTLNRPDGYTLVSYDVTLIDTSSGSIIGTLEEITTGINDDNINIDLSDNYDILNGTEYSISVIGNYTTMANIQVSSLAPSDSEILNHFTVIPSGSPIIDGEVTQFMKNSGDVVIRVDPNGRVITRILVIAVPNKVNVTTTQLKYYYNIPVEELPTAIVGDQDILLTDPFKYSDVSLPSDIVLEIGYLFVTNSTGVSVYEEYGTEDV